MPMEEELKANLDSLSDRLPSEKRSRRFSAAVLSAFIPGAGHFLLRKNRKATLFFVIFVVLMLAVWPFEIMRTYRGYWLSALAFLGLIVYSCCDALLSYSKNNRDVRSSRWWLLLFLPIALFFFFLNYNLLTRIAGFRNFSVPSSSMAQTIVSGDRIIADMHYYHNHSPNRGDLIILYRDKIFLIKRVIAIGGDTIQGIDQKIFLNGKPLNEPYVEHIQEDLYSPELRRFGPTAIPMGKYFVMGDNRDVSYDSRSQHFGLIANTEIRGKPLFIYVSSEDRSGRVLR
jgi:signal peptidase I